MDNSSAELVINDVVYSIKTGLNPRDNFSLNSDDARNWYITVRELNGTGVDFLPQTDRVNDSALKLINNRANLEPGDILFSGTGTIGKTAIVTEKPQNWNIKEGVYVLKPNLERIDPYYFLCILRYYAKIHVFDKQVAGSTVLSIPMSVLGGTKIYLPDMQKQKNVATTIRLIDDKIELNRRMNTELEQMAHTLYDYWFVQFDFPGPDGKPYKSSGGAMKHSPELNRQIPANWATGKLEDIISRSGTGLNPRDNFKLGQGSNYYVTIKNVENGKIVLDDKCDKIDDEALKIIQKRSDLQVGDILFTSIQPVGVTYRIREKPTNWNINESVFTIRPDIQKVSSDYLYVLLSSEEMKVYTTNSSAGSVHKGIRHGVLKDFNVTIPPKELIDDFSERISPILEKIHQNDQQSQILANLRDWLLPMLMNGQVKIRD